MYIDSELQGKSGKQYVTSYGRGNFYIGHPNQGDVPSVRYSTGNFDIDEMEIWYGKRDDLIAFGFIDRGM